MSKIVAIIVPLSTRTELTEDEKISLRHLEHFLGEYDKYLVMSQSLRFDYPGFRIKRFSDRFFGTPEAYSKLMLSRKLYESFSEYKYILVYHTDALVFSNQLLEWCQTDLDYIGAPWLKCRERPEMGFSEVGNGGFSLRKVSSFLKVLDSREYAIDPRDHWEKYYARKPKIVQYLNLPRKYLKHLRIFNGVKWEVRRTKRNEDRFWATRAKRFYADFTIAPVELALRFAFERAPRFCFERNNCTLPFGCHAWNRYDREFWEPYLLK